MSALRGLWTWALRGSGRKDDRGRKGNSLFRRLTSYPAPRDRVEQTNERPGMELLSELQRNQPNRAQGGVQPEVAHGKAGSGSQQAE